MISPLVPQPHLALTNLMISSSPKRDLVLRERRTVVFKRASQMTMALETLGSLKKGKRLQVEDPVSSIMRWWRSRKMWMSNG